MENLRWKNTETVLGMGQMQFFTYEQTGKIKPDIVQGLEQLV